MGRERERVMDSMGEEKIHAVLVPFPAQSHITAMFKLAKLLHSKSIHITFVNTEFNHNRLIRSQGPDSVKGLPDFRFETIPDGLPPPVNDNATQDVPSLCDSTTKNCLVPFRDLLKRLNNHPSSGVPAVTCIISDGVMTFTLDAAAELGIPNALLWTMAASTLLALHHCQHLIARGLIPFKDASHGSNGYLDTVVDWIPGLTKNMRLRDFPTYIRTTDPEDVMLNFARSQVERAPMASAIIVNTFEELERPALEAIASVFPPIYPIGPISLLTCQLPPGNPLVSLSSSLWKEETSCMEWLRGRERNSVVYVNFGSIAVMTKEQMVEFAWGLANSGQDFLWVIRPDLFEGDSASLPKEFLVETKERGILASWCLQEVVLSYPAIGGFLTHCGWNSTIESISEGVPMICWPFFADQQTNCRYACTEWGIGMEIDNDVKREEVEKMIRELMGGEKGKEMRRMALEWKEAAVRATRAGGTSCLNLERMVKEVLVIPKQKGKI